VSTLYTTPADPPGSVQAWIGAPPRTSHPPTFSTLVQRRDPEVLDSYRREVAILFADITGFTELAETVDPEVVYARVSPLLDALVVCLHEHGGDVQQVLGDGFMAAFGLHNTRGDEAERAVCAGRVMIATAAAHPHRLKVHVGIEYGEVLVTPPREPASFSVWGHAINVAQRLCDVAAPGQLVVGPAAFAQCGHRLRCAGAMVLRLHGITESVVAYRIAPS
jgi:class 3 adenylate cyclase